MSGCFTAVLSDAERSWWRRWDSAAAAAAAAALAATCVQSVL